MMTCASTTAMVCMFAPVDYLPTERNPPVAGDEPRHRCLRLDGVDERTPGSLVRLVPVQIVSPVAKVVRNAKGLGRVVVPAVSGPMLLGQADDRDLEDLRSARQVAPASPRPVGRAILGPPLGLRHGKGTAAA